MRRAPLSLSGICASTCLATPGFPYRRRQARTPTRPSANSTVSAGPSRGNPDDGDDGHHTKDHHVTAAAHIVAAPCIHTDSFGVRSAHATASAGAQCRELGARDRLDVSASPLSLHESHLGRARSAVFGQHELGGVDGYDRGLFCNTAPCAFHHEFTNGPTEPTADELRVAAGRPILDVIARPDSRSESWPRTSIEKSSEPQYEFKSDMTDHIAMHKGSALRKLRT